MIITYFYKLYEAEKETQVEGFSIPLYHHEGHLLVHQSRQEKGPVWIWATQIVGAVKESQNLVHMRDLRLEI